MANQRTNESKIKTTPRVFDIIETLLANDGATVTEIADELGMAKSTASDHLSTLLDEELIVREEDEFTPGLKLLDYGSQTREKMGIYHTSKNELEELANQTNEVAWLIVEEHGQGVFLRKAEGSRAVTTNGYIGSRSHLHYIASGKAMLANFPDERVESIIEKRGLPEATSKTITDKSRLLSELEEVKKQGYAFNDEEEVEQVRAVGAPIIVGGEVLGGIAVAGPLNRIRGDRFRTELPNQVMAAAETISLQISHNTAV